MILIVLTNHINTIIQVDELEKKSLNDFLLQYLVFLFYQSQIKIHKSS